MKEYLKSMMRKTKPEMSDAEFDKYFEDFSNRANNATDFKVPEFYQNKTDSENVNIDKLEPENNFSEQSPDQESIESSTTDSKSKPEDAEL